MSRSRSNPFRHIPPQHIGCDVGYHPLILEIVRYLK